MEIIVNFKDLRVDLIDFENLILTPSTNVKFKLFKDNTIPNLLYGYKKYTYDNGKIRGDRSTPITYVYLKEGKYYLSVFKDWTVNEAKTKIRQLIREFNGANNE